MRYSSLSNNCTLHRFEEFQKIPYYSYLDFYKSKTIWTDQNFLHMVQKVKFSSEKSFLVWTKTFLPVKNNLDGSKMFWTYRMTRHGAKSFIIIYCKGKKWRSLDRRILIISFLFLSISISVYIYENYRKKLMDLIFYISQYMHWDSKLLPSL